MLPVCDYSFVKHSRNMSNQNDCYRHRKCCCHICIERTQIVMQYWRNNPQVIKQKSKKVGKQNKCKQPSKKWKIHASIFFLADIICQDIVQPFDNIKSKSTNFRKFIRFDGDVKNTNQHKQKNHKHPSGKHGCRHRKTKNMPNNFTFYTKNMRSRMCCSLGCGSSMKRFCSHKKKVFRRKVYKFRRKVYKKEKKNQIFSQIL